MKSVTKLVLLLTAPFTIVVCEVLEVEVLRVTENGSRPSTWGQERFSFWSVVMRTRSWKASPVTTLAAEREAVADKSSARAGQASIRIAMVATASGVRGRV